MKLPPFAKPLYELINKGLRPNNDIFMFIGRNSWKKGKSFSISYPTQTLILPPWRAAIDFLWPVKCCDILIIDTGFSDEEYIHELVYCLYRADANNVRLITTNFSLILFKKDI